MTRLHPVKPPRGAVKLTDHRPDGGWQVDCAHCGFHYPPAPYVSTRTDAEDHKRDHRCLLEDEEVRP